MADMTKKQQAALAVKLQQALTYEALITGLTPGSTYDFIWQQWALAAATCTFKLDAPNGYQATMSATPIH